MCSNDGVLKVQDMLNEVSAGLGEHKERQAEISARLLAVEQLAVKLESEGRGVPVSDPQAAKPSSMIINGKVAPVLAKTDRVANYTPMNYGGEEPITLGHMVKAKLGVEKPRFVVTGGPETVPEYLSASILDDARANSVTIGAGASTILIPGKTTFGRIEGDPEVYIHEEGQEDVSESVPNFAPVEVAPLTMVALVGVSAELLQDSPNSDLMLRASIGGAFGLKLDQMCLTTLLADPNIPGSITGEAVNTWPGVLSAAGSALALDQQLPLAHISHPTDFMARNSVLSANYGWQSRPKLLENMAELYTTSMTPGLAVMGDFAQGFAVCVRSDLQIDVIRYAKSKAFSHLLVCHLRAKGVVLQPKRLYVQATTTSGL